MASFAMPFSPPVHMCTKITELEGVHGAPETGRGFVIHYWFSVWTDAWSVILQPIVHTSTEEV